MTTTVYLIRHGVYENPKQIFHGRLPGFPLSADGIQMVKRIAGYLAREPIVAVYSSRLTRAYQTAQIIAKTCHTNVIVNRKLLDVRTPLQGKSLAYTESIDSDFYTEDLVRAGGERLVDVYRRMDGFIRSTVRQHSGQSSVVVSHGDPIMSIATVYSGKPLPRRFTMHEWYVPQASGFKIEFDETEKPVSVTKLQVNAS